MEKEGTLPSTTITSGDTTYDAERVLFLSDIHFPFQDQGCLDQIFELIKRESFDRIVLNGDLLDFYDISRFTSKQHVPIETELDAAKAFLAQLRSIFDGHIDYTVGNHEERLELYLRTDATKLAGLKCLEIPELLNLAEYGVEFHQKDGFLLRPNFLVYHGVIVRKHSGWSAKGELEKHGISGISGHTHRLESFHMTDRAGTRAWFEQGCLCTLDAEYIVGVPNWQQGFAIGEFSRNSDWFQIERVPFSGGRLRYRGVDYSQCLHTSD